MVVRYEHASTERDAHLAKSLPPLLPVGRPTLDSLETGPFEIGSEQEESSGGETRTLNLAGLFEENLDLRFSPNNDAELDI